MNEIERLRERHRRLLLEAEDARAAAAAIRLQAGSDPTGEEFNRLHSLETQAEHADHDAAEVAMQLARAQQGAPVVARHEHVLQRTEQQEALRDLLGIYKKTTDPGRNAIARQKIVEAANMLVPGVMGADAVALAELYADGPPLDWSRFVRHLYWQGRIREVEYHVMPPAMALVPRAELVELFRQWDQRSQEAGSELCDFGQYIAKYIGLMVSWHEAVDLARLYLELSPTNEDAFSAFGQQAARSFSGDGPAKGQLFRMPNDLPSVGRIRIF